MLLAFQGALVAPVISATGETECAWFVRTSAWCVTEGSSRCGSVGRSLRVVVALVTGSIGWMPVTGREEVGTETRFDLKYMASEVAKRHVRSNSSLQLGTKSRGNTTEDVSNEEEVFGVGRKKELLKVDLVFVVGYEFFILSEVAANAPVYEIVEAIRRKESVLQLFGPRSPGSEGSMFLLRKAGVVIEGIAMKEGREETKNVAVGGFKNTLEATNLLDPFNNIVIVTTVEFGEVGRFETSGLGGCLGGGRSDSRLRR